MTAAKRDAEVYVGRAEQAKAIEKMQERRAAAATDGAGTKRKRGGEGEERAVGDAMMRRQFKQRQPLPDRLMGTHHVAPVIGEGTA